jgi:hypothetical protein
MQRVIARRKIFDIAVIAGEYNRRAFEIKPYEQLADEKRETG